jgi:hypothetical protein
MSKFFSSLLSPTALLYIYLGLMQTAQGVYATGEFEPPPAFSLVYSAGLLWIVGWWLLTDSRRRDIPWVYDIGLYLTIAWWFIMPYYLLKTRGAKGLLLILAFVGTYMAASVVGMSLYLLFTLSLPN